MQVTTLYQATVEAVSGVDGICASCSFSADSTTEGCVIELQSDENFFVFNIPRNKQLEFDCFSVPEAGVYNVFTYETPLGIHPCRELSSVTIRKSESKKCLNLET